MANKTSKNIQTVLEILRDEVRGDVSSALKKMTSDYSMTWMYKSSKTLFPTTKKSIRKELEAVYPIKGRSYHINHIAEGSSVVMVELIESYPDSKTKKVHRTPLVLVLEIENGKIKTGRHYCDPQVSHLHLPQAKIAKAFRGKKKTIIIK